jgi:lipoprotein signal peptidase
MTLPPSAYNTGLLQFAMWWEYYGFIILIQLTAIMIILILFYNLRKKRRWV